LQEEVERIKALSPHDIRIAELLIGRNGLAGPEVAETATKALDEDEEEVNLTTLMFMAKVIMAGNAMTPEIVAGLADGTADDMVRTAAYEAAQAIGVRPSQLDDKLARLAKVVGPLGIEGAPQPSRLRRVLRELHEFKASTERWAEENPHGEVDVARFCAEVADVTLERAVSVANQFDTCVRDPLNVLQNWDREIGALHGHVIRLSWLLDGWDALLNTWQAVATAPRQDQDQALITIFRALPLLPKSEYTENEAKRNNRLRISRKRSIRMYEDWNTGEVDYDMVARIEAAKARR
jgi:hypothetical protein